MINRDSIIVGGNRKNGKKNCKALLRKCRPMVKTIRNEIKELTKDNFIDFIKSNYIAVIYVYDSSFSDFLRGVCKKLREKFPNQVKFGEIDISKIEKDDFISKMYIGLRQMDLGRSPDEPVLNGYYLFIDGNIAGYHSGFMDIEKDKLQYIFGGIVGFISLLKWDEKGLNEAIRIAEMGAVNRVVSFFVQQIRQSEAQRQWREEWRERQAQNDYNELQRAYSILGATEKSTDDEVKKAFRDLIKENHPDKFPVDSNKQEHATRITSEITRAYHLIMNFRQRN